jgi:hypothetical protein
MKPAAADRDKLNADGGSPDPGYAAWKQAKVEQGLAQTADRAGMIPVDQIWRELKLER